MNLQQFIEKHRATIDVSIRLDYLERGRFCPKNINDAKRIEKVNSCPEFINWASEEGVECPILHVIK